MVSLPPLLKAQCPQMKPAQCGTTLPPLLTPTLPPLLTPTAFVSASTPPATLPALMRLQLPPVDRSTPRWVDCLFWLSQKQGGGYVRAEDVDRLCRSGEELKPLTERRRSYNAKRVTLPTLQLPALLSPVSQNDQGDCSTAKCVPTSSPTLPPLMANASSLQPLQPLRAAGNAPTARDTTRSMPPIAGVAVTLPPLRKV